MGISYGGSRSPAFRFRVLLIFQGFWVLTVCLLGAWWRHLLLKQAAHIAELERSAGIAATAVHSQLVKTQHMLYWESGGFFAFLVASMILFFSLYWRDLARARSMQTFFASVTHELRTPLTSIRLQADSIADGLPESDQKTKTLIQRLMQDTARLEIQVERTLELARAEGGGPIFIEPLQLRPVIDRFLSSAAGPLTSTAQVSNAVEDVEVMADFSALQVILRNLFDNSARHSEANPLKISISSERREDQVILSFADNGAGTLSRDEVQGLGKIFRKGHHSQGAGVGLYLIRVLMSRMGGEARFSSQDGFKVMLHFAHPHSGTARDLYD